MASELSERLRLLAVLGTPGHHGAALTANALKSMRAHD
jgi:hypothetical protein